MDEKKQNTAPEPSTRQWVTWVDLIRTIGIILVVVIHTAGPLLYRLGDISETDWMTGNIFDGLARISVPLLFMVSGYLLLSHQESISSFYYKRFWKVFIPLLAWSLVYLLEENNFKGYTFINAVKTYIYYIIQFPLSFHLWFLYDLLAIYLFVPILRMFVKSADDSHLWYFAILWFLFGPVLDITQHIVDLKFAIDLGFFTSYIGYFVIGYILGKQDLPNKWFIPIGILYGASAVYTIYATWQASHRDGELVQYYYNYLRINVVIMSICAFLLLKKLGQSIRNLSAIQGLKHFATVSFGIYLVHAYVLLYLRRANIDAFSGPALISIPAVSILIVLISWGITLILQRIPILKLTVPK